MWASTQFIEEIECINKKKKKKQELDEKQQTE